MASTREKHLKDGTRIFEIRVWRGNGQKPMSMSWQPPVGWSEKIVQRELTKVSTEFERKVKSGEIISKTEQKELEAQEEAERAKLKTIKQYAEGVFMPTKEQTLSENTKANYQQFLDNQVYPQLGNVLIAEVSPAMLAKRLLDYQKTGKSHSSCIKLYNILNGVFEMAFMDDTIPINPMLKVKRPVARKDEQTEEETEKALTVEQLKYVLACVEAEPLKWKVFINLAADTGCRRGELCGLQWTDIDWDNSMITIRHNLQYTAGKGVYTTTPKNGKSRRVDIGNDMIELLKQWKAEQMKECVCKYVFSPEKSNQFKHSEQAEEPETNKAKKKEKPIVRLEPNAMHPQTPTRYFKKFGEKYGIPGFHPHLLRHTSASISIVNGADVVSVSERLGHSDTAVTLRMYAHANEESIRNAGQIARNALKEDHKKAENG